MEQSKLSKREIKNRNITIVIFVIIVVGLIIMNIYEGQLLKKDYRYTVGKIYEIRGANSGYRPHYTYFVNNKKYDGSTALKQPDYSLVGKRFIVKFHPPNPSICNILLSKPVHDSIKEIPEFGWSEIEFIKIFGRER